MQQLLQRNLARVVPFSTRPLDVSHIAADSHTHDLFVSHISLCLHLHYYDRTNNP